MDVPITSDEWWKNAVFYCLDVETYCDSDGDGVGDVRGLIQRLDHLAALGVTCIWLMPLMPSANRDDGYDVLDHYAVDPRLGSLGDLVDLLREARERGLRVIIDLVLNHTSDRHPWFVRSRSDPSSRERSFYVWKDEPQDWPDEPAFPGEEDENWTLDEVAGLWYLHRFYRFQPDLDIGCPELREEMRRIMGFWLELGASGFRLDALPFVLEAADRDPAREGHGYLRQMRAFLSRRSAGAVFLGEVNLPPEEQRRFFGDEDGDEAHLLTAFDQNNALFLALARETAAPLADELRSLPAIPSGSQWATFVRNHDELSLSRLSPEERDEVLDRFAPEERMRIYGRGLRRRLPTMLDGDEAWLRSVYALLLALPGAPILYYGEEIGMGEDLDAPGRLSVRTPMQWTGGANGGFSTAPAGRLVRRVVEGRFGPERVNVADQRRDQGSFLHWLTGAIRARREAPEIGWGDWQVADCGDERVLCLQARWQGRCVTTLTSLSPDPVDVSIVLGGPQPEELLADRDYALIEGDEARFELAGRGFRWLRVDLAG